MPTRQGDVLIWGAENIEENTIRQAEATARLPFVARPLALMPDAHLGIGATVGSVAFMLGAIVPAAVGVDIGCGMVASRTNLTADHLPDDLAPLLSLIEAAIPAGLGKGHAESHHKIAVPPHPTPPSVIDDKTQANVYTQFGTLGSGNHFVEICLDEMGRVWVVLHSGSRGIGNKLAQRHISAAKGLMKCYFIKLEDPDLAYAVEGTAEFDAYVADMLWSQDYAAGSRDAMMSAALTCLRQLVPPTNEVERINCHHNFAARERHHGKDGWVIRKGAIRARVGDRGVIPGSMGTSSFIVTGLGNASSYHSCSHGAGRRLSRSAARADLTVESLTAAMGDRTWQQGDASELIDEHPAAYKDVEAVMASQADLVQIDHRLVQVLNYKGTK